MSLPPPCPLTGAPPKRHLQWLSTKMLASLWRYSFGVDVRDQLAGIDRFGLWEAPSGLLYFDPPLAGDYAFYQSFYAGYGMHERLAGSKATRPEFVLAASHIAPGSTVLDVGCGEGGFRRYIPTAQYTGLDLNFGGSRPDVLAETLDNHAASHPETYDVVCAFQVIEHVPDPLAFVAMMLTALKPGGRILIGVPCHPSMMTVIPNFVLNAPPHHLTLWTEKALRILARQTGVECHAVQPIPVGTHHSLAYWMGRIAPKFNSPRLFLHAWSWHLGLVWCYAAGSVLALLSSVPPDARPLDLLMVADKPT